MNPMNVQSISIKDIIIPPRRREDYGNLDELAENIRVRKLLHPITVVVEGDEYKLAAGERRLRAYQILGETEIPCRIYDELSEEERLLIELEENLNRKDLSQYEINKKIAQAAEATAEKLREDFLRSDGKKSTPSKGRPSKPDSEARVAEAMNVPGVTQQVVSTAKQHVAAVESHPDLKEASQKEAIAVAKEREPAKPKSHFQPLTKPLSKSNGGQSGQFNKWNAKVLDFKAELDAAGGAETLTAAWQETERFIFFGNLKELNDLISEYVIDLGEHLNDLKDASGF